MQEPAVGQTVTVDEPPVGATVQAMGAQAAQAASPGPSLDTGLLLPLEVSKGIMKGAANTAIGLGELVHKIPGVSAAIDSFYGTPGLSEHAFPVAREAVEPTNAAQSVGKLAEQTGEFFLPTGLGGKLGKLADALKAAGIATAQTGSPTVGAITGAVTGGLGALAPPAADALHAGANTSMIRALGPAAGRGPTGAASLANAEAIAPDLVKAGFTPLTQVQARTMATTAVQNAGTQLKTALSTFGSDPGDVPALLDAVKAKRAALQVPKAGGGSFLDSGTAAADGIWQALQSDLEQVDPTVNGLHTLKSKWNDLVNNFQADPAKGTEQFIYRAGGDLIRAQMAKDSAKVSQADKLFSFASKLRDLVTDPSVRRPGPGVTNALMPLARPAVGMTLGGAEGYREGGLPGAAVGAAGGFALGNLIQSPGFRFLSAAMKSKLADALDKGQTGTVRALVASMTAQAANLASSNGG